MQNTNISKIAPITMLTLLSLLTTTLCFQFKSAYISASPTTINTYSQYSISIQRQFTQQVAPTPWDTQPVPSGSNITIIFPKQFKLTNTQTCEYLIINFVPLSSTAYTCNIDIDNNKISYMNAIQQDSYISDISIMISNVLNPYPSIMTSPFLVIVGNDYSANDSFSAVQLTASAFNLNNSMITFSNPLVNISSNMLITLKTTNKLPGNISVIVIKFPYNLQWIQDIAGNGHQLQILSATCIGLQNVNVNLICNGMQSTQQIYISNISSLDIDEGSIIKFMVSGLFSPPTQNPIDVLTITSRVGINSIYYDIDTITTHISSLTARTLSDLSIQPSSSIRSINTFIGLIINFTILDTISNIDYFQIQFPLNTSITYSTSMSSFSLSSIATYNTSTCILKLTQNTISQIKYAGFSAYITFLSYRTPVSTKPTDSIKFRVMKNGYAKMRGSTVFVADAKNYNYNVSANDSNINGYGMYVLAFVMADGLDRSGYIVIGIPKQLSITNTLPIVSISSSSNSSINLSPTVTSINTTSLYNYYNISNLNKTQTSTAVPPQTINITLTGIRNPNSVYSVNTFQFMIYYSYQGYLTARSGVQSGSINIVGGVLSAMGVGVNVSITSSMAVMVVNMSNQNIVPVGGAVYIAVPVDIVIASGVTCQVSSGSTVVYGNTCTIISTNSTHTLLSLQITTQIPQASPLSLQITPITTPISTMPTQSIYLYTTNQNNKTIDIQPSSTLLILTMLQPIQLKKCQLIRVSMVNSLVNQYSIGVESVQVMYVGGSGSMGGNVMYVGIPVEVGIQAGMVVSMVNVLAGVSVGLGYSVVGNVSSAVNTLKITLPVSLPATNLSSYTFLFTNLINPPSLKPTSVPISIKLSYILTSTSVQYTYAIGSTPILQNTQTSPLFLSYKYNNSILFAQSALSINLTLIAYSNISYVIYQFDSKLGIKNGVLGSGLLCNALQIGITCIITSLTPTIVLKIQPTNTSLTFPSPTLSITIPSSILTPTTYLSSYQPSFISTYDSTNYPISRNNSYIVFIPMCTLPCWTCTSSTLSSQCTSCYLVNHNITNLVYYMQTGSMGYGTCNSNCPTGYTTNTNTSLGYTCIKCDVLCPQCTYTATNCTKCISSQYLILYNVSTSSYTCVTVCPSSTYPYLSTSPTDTNICKSCPIQCSTCNSSTQCITCTSPYYYYSTNTSCLLSCPSSISILNTTSGTCMLCSSMCMTCSIKVNNCTSCVGGLVLLGNGTCSSGCGNISMIVINGVCTVCDGRCYTCSIVVDNCTSCNTTSVYRYYYNYTCLQKCPQTYYSPSSTNTSTSSYICQSCSSLPSLNCLNCSTNGQYCLSCNTGYVYYNNTQCLDYVPNGYVNISGNATKCDISCSTCSITTTNCTSCISTLNLYNNSCISVCPAQTTAVNSVCILCTTPCYQCAASSPTYCTSCISPYYLSVSTHKCVNSSSCPTNTYPNTTLSQCSSCVTPCLACTSSTKCSTCIHGYYFYSITVLCLDVCPLGWVGVVNVCMLCLTPCRYCQLSITKCTACISGYYLNVYTHQCLLQCPVNITIPNPITMTCDTCQLPCLTCTSQVSICTSCIVGSFLYGNQCFGTCIGGYYGQVSNRTCMPCDSICKYCTQTALQCTACYNGKYLYQYTCVDVCPEQYGIVIRSIASTSMVCTQCANTIQYCIRCTINRICLQCQNTYILLNGICYQQCPQSYTFQSQTNKCITINDNAKKQLDNILSSTSVFPMPFICIGFSLFIACLMSKLQNKNTYLIGAVYSVAGVLQTASLVFLIIKYADYTNSQLPITTTSVMGGSVGMNVGMSGYGQGRYLQSASTTTKSNQFPILVVGLIIIYAINLIGFLIQTPYLYYDQKIQTWLKNTFHKIFYIIITILSLLINYKLKLIIFSKLFSFTSTRSQLESVQKFRVFNILSFLGVSHQVFVIYISVVLITKLQKGIINNQIFLTFIDTIAITCVSIVLSLAANKKDDDFFVELADNGYVLNKKVMVQGDDLGQDGLKPKFLIGDENKGVKVHQMDSFQKMLNNEHDEQYQDQQISLSISENRSQIDRKQKARRQKEKDKMSQNSQAQGGNNDRQKGQKMSKSQKNLKKLIGMSNQETSNPIKRQLLHAGQNHHDNNMKQIGKQSVIFDREKIYDEEDVISRNQTVMFQSPSKQEKQIKENKIEIQKNKNNQIEYVHGSEKQLLEAENSKLNQTKQEGKQKYDTITTLTKDQRQVHNQQQKSKQQKQKQDKFKIYRQEKDLRKSQKQSEEIQDIIAKKMRQLQGLKKQANQKQARSRSKQKIKSTKPQFVINSQKDKQKPKTQRQQPSSIFNQVPVANQFIQTNQQQFPQKQVSSKSKQTKQKSKSRNIFDQQQQSHEIILPDDHAYDDLIRQNSTLIRQQKQQQLQKQKELAQEKQHAIIQQQIQTINVLSVSKVYKENQSQDKRSNKNKNNLSVIAEDLHQQASANLNIQNSNGKSDSSNKKQKLKTNNNQSSIKETSGWFVDDKDQEKKEKSQKQKQKQIQQDAIEGSKDSTSKKQHQKHKNIYNMFDSFIQQNKSMAQQQEDKQSKQKTKKTQEIQQNVSIIQKNMKKQKSNRGIDIGIGQQFEEVKDEKNKNKQLKQNEKKSKQRYKNVFEQGNQSNDMQDSGLDDSRPDMDQQINHHPLKSSFATDQQKSIQVIKDKKQSFKNINLKNPKESNNQININPVQHPLVGILQAGSNKHHIPRTNQQQQVNRQQEIATKLKSYGKPDDQKTLRKQQRPPIQRPSSQQKSRPSTNQRGRIYAAGLRQFEDQTLTKKNSYDQPLQQRKGKISYQQQQLIQPQVKLEEKKKNKSLYNVPLKKYDSKQMTSSDHTEQILIKPGYFNQNSSSQQNSFVHPKYTSTMHVDSGNEPPEKPKIDLTARGNYQRTGTSQERGGRIRRSIDQQNVTAGERVFMKKHSVEYEVEDHELEDELDDFYGKQKERKNSKSPKRSKSKQRKPSQQSVKRMKQLEKIYLQKLQLPKRQ